MRRFKANNEYKRLINNIYNGHSLFHPIGAMAQSISPGNRTPLKKLRLFGRICPDRCPFDRRDQSGSGSGDQGSTSPRRPLLPDSGFYATAAAIAGTRRRRSAAGRTLSAQTGRQTGHRARRNHAAGRRATLPIPLAGQRAGTGKRHRAPWFRVEAQ